VTSWSLECLIHNRLNFNIWETTDIDLVTLNWGRGVEWVNDYITNIADVISTSHASVTYCLHQQIRCLDSFLRVPVTHASCCSSQPSWQSDVQPEMDYLTPVLFCIIPGALLIYRRMDAHGSVWFNTGPICIITVIIHNLCNKWHRSYTLCYQDAVVDKST